MRACWEDGATPLPPDPVTPGLLDLLTVRGLGEPRDGQLTQLPRAAAIPRPAREGSRRLWVELEG